jgi:thiol-disulfide isomerase/thioredoxin
MGASRVALLGVGLLFLGCDEEGSKTRSLAPAQRSQAIEGTATATTAAEPDSAPAPSAPGSVSKKPRAPLCGGALDSEGRAVARKPIGRRGASGETDLPVDPSFTGGYTWVNFWAAWCVPCKEEIPRLLDWQKRISASGKSFRVLFVSLDDDERQLEKFLGDQPAGGLRSTYWLREGKEREEWLLGAGVDPDPDLPMHLLLDAKGKVRCTVRGAVEDSDYPGLLALLGS